MNEDRRSRAARSLRWLIPLGLAIFAGIVAVSPIRDADFFWHLANGREMLREHRIVSEEIFSYTRPGVRFSNHAWLGQVVLAAVFARAGTAGVILFKAAVVAACSALLFAAARASGARRASAAALVMLALSISADRFKERPEIFSLLAFAVVGAISASVLSGRLKRAWLWIVPPLLAVWDVLHGAVYGYLYLTALLAGEAAQYVQVRRVALRQRGPAPDTSHLRSLAVCWGAGLAVGIASPFGLRRYDFFTAFLSANRMVAQTNEFQPPTLTLNPLFWVAAVAFIAAVVLRGRKTRLGLLLPALAFLLLAFRYRRAIPFFAFAAVPAAAAMAASLVSEAATRWMRRSAAIVCVGLAAFAVFLKLPSRGGPQRLGLDLDPIMFPTGSARFLSAVRLSGHLYNPGHFGGYLAWQLHPAQPIYLYNNHAVFGDVPTVFERPQLLDEKDVQVAVVERWLLDGPAYPAVLSIFDRERWALVFFDDASLVFVREGPANARVLDGIRLRLLSPTVAAAVERYPASEDELKPYESSPEMGLTLAREIASCVRFYKSRSLADYLGYLVVRNERVLDPAAALSWIDAALGENDGSAYLWVAQSRLRARLGDAEGARRSAEIAAQRDPRVVQ